MNKEVQQQDDQAELMDEILEGYEHLPIKIDEDRVEDCLERGCVHQAMTEYAAPYQSLCKELVEELKMASEYDLPNKVKESIAITLTKADNILKQK